MKHGVNLSEIIEYHTNSDPVTYTFPVEKSCLSRKTPRKSKQVEDGPKKITIFSSRNSSEVGIIYMYADESYYDHQEAI